MRDDEMFGATRRSSFPWAGCAAVVGAVGLAWVVAIGAFVAEPASRWWAGEITLSGEPTYAPRVAPDAAVIGGIDFAAVHAKLWPEYVIAASRARYDAASFEAAGAALRAEAGRDANLDALLVELHGILGAGPAAQSERVLYLCWSWNDYLDRQSIPWRIDCVVRYDDESGTFYAKTYNVLHTASVTVGGKPFRAHYLARVDGLNVVEGYLGSSYRHEEGAKVVVDRVVEHAVSRVWPLLDPALDAEREPLDAAFAARVREEAAAALPPETLAVLTRTASSRFAMERAAKSVRDRASCGSAFSISALPWDGLPVSDQAGLREWAQASVGERCPAVTEEEAEALISASLAIKADPELPEALERLVAFVARGIVAHEARHAADDAAVGFDVELPCSVCDGMDAGSRAELSAYLAAFATPDLGFTAMYQACDAMRDGLRGSHGVALQALGPELLPDGCEGGPPADLAVRAAVLEASWLGRSEPIVFPDGLPERLPVARLVIE